MDKIGFLFDLDGVLIDSEREYTKIWNEIEKEYPTGIENFAYKIKGQTLGKILSDNYPDPEIREKVTVRLHVLEKKMRYRYCEGAENLLERINEKGGKIAVVTSSDEVKMAHLHSDLPSFRNKVGVIIDASKVHKSKPDPEGYLLGAKKLGADIAKSVVFEDSVQGVRAGNASSAYVVGITGTKSRDELLPYSDIVIDSLLEINLEELIDLLKNR